MVLKYIFDMNFQETVTSKVQQHRTTLRIIIQYFCCQFHSYFIFLQGILQNHVYLPEFGPVYLQKCAKQVLL